MSLWNRFRQKLSLRRRRDQASVDLQSERGLGESEILSGPDFDRAPVTDSVTRSRPRKARLLIGSLGIVLLGAGVLGAGWWVYSGSDLTDIVHADIEPRDNVRSGGFILPPRLDRRNGLKNTQNNASLMEQKLSSAEKAGLQGSDDKPLHPAGSTMANGLVSDKTGQSNRPSGGLELAASPEAQATTNALELNKGPLGAKSAVLKGNSSITPSRLEREFGLQSGQPSPGVGVIARAASLTFIDELPDLGGGNALAVLDPNLVETLDDGAVIPTIGDDGRQPWLTYAKPSQASGKRVAILINDMGLSTLATEAVIARFPAEVTLAFSPYGPKAQQLAQRARSAGHEVWLSLPMEPLDFPVTDPGPLGLFTNIDVAANMAKMNAALSKIDAFVGVSTKLGTRFVTTRQHYQPVLETLKQRGLAIIDLTGSTQSLTPVLGQEFSLPWAQSSHKLTAANDMKRELEALEREVNSGAVVLVSVQPYPRVLKHLAAWLSDIDAKGISLVPVSATLRSP